MILWNLPLQSRSPPNNPLVLVYVTGACVYARLCVFKMHVCPLGAQICIQHLVPVKKSRKRLDGGGGEENKMKLISSVSHHLLRTTIAQCQVKTKQDK